MFIPSAFNTCRHLVILVVIALLQSTSNDVLFSQTKASADSQQTEQTSTVSAPTSGKNRPQICCGQCTDSADDCRCHAPDFIYHPSRKLLKDRYTRIQDCQAEMVMRPGDEFWWVSSRHLPLRSCNFQLCVYRYQDCQAIRSSLPELKKAHDEKPSLVNFVYIHENRADLNKSEMRFWQSYNILINQAPNAPPVRYIFFTWPADKQRGQARDVREKAEICDFHSLYLGWFFCQIQDFNKVSIGGYSYGSRLAIDALHLAGGGTKRCQALPKEILITQPKFRAAFVATAMQNGCLSEGGLCGPSYQTFDHVTLLNNSTDKVLGLFPLLPPRGFHALGREGVCNVAQLKDGGKRLTQVDCCNIAGKSHKLEDYYKSELLRQLIRDTIFWRKVELKCCQ